MLKINDLARQYAQTATQVEQAALRVLRSGWYVLGPEVAAFERDFATYCGSTHAVGVANGTDAIELALRALGDEAGGEVITAANAGMYAAVAILAAGATPRFADVDAHSMTLDPEAVRRALTPRTRAIVVTHLYGRAAAMPPLLAIAREARVALIEDCAQAHGVRSMGRRVGSLGTLGCFSFYPTKNLGALGDGGAIVTDDPALERRLRQLRQYGWTTKYHADLPGGRNSRLDELQAALLATQLPDLDRNNARRNAIARALSAGIRHPDIVVPEIDDYHVAHLYVVRSRGREALRAHLAGQGVASDVHYPVPDHRQPALARHVGKVTLPVTERLAQEVLTLPCFAQMSDAETARVIAACNGWRP